MWFGRRLLRSLGESVIWNSPSITAFYGNSGTEFWGCRADCVPEFLPRAMRIAPRELLESFHEPLGATPLRLPAAPEIREGGAKREAPGDRAVALRIKRSRSH